MVGQLWLIHGDYICDECYKLNKRVVIKNYQKIEITYNFNVHKTYGKKWTKWGGENNDLHPISLEWYCQACTEKQTIELPSYLIRIEKQEYARICSVCLHVALDRKINNIFDLRAITQPQHNDFG
jgi:hypothetical protein